MLVRRIGRLLIVTITIIFVVSCIGQSPQSKATSTAERMVMALNEFCVLSESSKQEDVMAKAMSIAGYTYGDDSRFHQENLSVALGGKGMKFCDIQIFGAPIDLASVTENLNQWAGTDAIDLALIEGPEGFTSGDDIGTRIVWGRDKIRLAAYVYENDRTDGRRARIMYDAF